MKSIRVVAMAVCAAWLGCSDDGIYAPIAPLDPVSICDEKGDCPDAGNDAAAMPDAEK